MTTVLDVRGLDVPFGDGPGLRDISFALAEGERLALVGPSGSGKTSLLRALAGSGRVTAGDVFVGGARVTDLSPDRRGTVLLAQRPLLFPHLSVFENVAFPLRVRGVKGAEVARRVRDALALVRMADLQDRSPSALSGGQAHRVALARAVVARPRVLLLDEPLSSLDPALREEVRQAILDVQSEYGPAMVLVTHDLEEAGRSVDRVAVVLEGGVAQIGPPEVIFRHPASAALARFLGFPNEVPGMFGASGLRLAGWAVEGGASEERGAALAGAAPVTVLFGTDGGHLAPSSTPGIPATVVAVLHHPHGVTARIVIPVAGEGMPSGPERTFSLELAVAAECPPPVGQELSLVLDPRRLHVFADDEHRREGRDR